jgi:hypothetical protein
VDPRVVVKEMTERNNRTPGHPARSLTTLQTEISWNLYARNLSQVLLRDTCALMDRTFYTVPWGLFRTPLRYFTHVMRHVIEKHEFRRVIEMCFHVQVRRGYADMEVRR